MYTPGAIRLCILPLLILTAACNDDVPTDNGQGTPQVARVRIVHAAPGLPNVEVIRAGTPAVQVAQNLNYGSFTQSCVQLPAGTAHTLAFRQGGTELASVTFTPVANEKYTAFLTAAGTTRRAFVLSDQHTATAGSNAVRFINASSGPGDVYVTVPNGAVVASARVHGNIGITAMGNVDPAYMATDTARKQVRLYDVDATTGTPRADLTLSGLPTSRLASVVLTDPASAGPSASFVAFPC